MQNRIPEIADVIAANFSKPAVTLFVAQFGESLVASMKDTKVGAKVKEHVKTGTLQQRFEMHEVALGMFIDDKEVLEIYERDLLNPALNDTRVTRIDSNSSESWGAVRVELANLIFPALVPSGKTSAPRKADDAIVAERIKAAADLLAKATDGVLADGEKRVIIGEDHFMRYGTVTVPKCMLQAFYDIGSRTGDSEVKRVLLKKLESIRMLSKKWLKEQPHGRGSNTFQAYKKDLEYLIALYKGDPPAESDSRFSNSDRK